MRTTLTSLARGLSTVSAERWRTRSALNVGSTLGIAVAAGPTQLWAAVPGTGGALLVPAAVAALGVLPAALLPAVRALRRAEGASGSLEAGGRAPGRGPRTPPSPLEECTVH
ncbi:hypothetical protein GCM10009665_67750 [Kitasatospora nipponensis]|uniref:Transmembrane secretion effector n=1 Tax=Kitasatospora nipponensis TaxID=258049 RepID=A0ABP4HJC0_9ACTN